MTASHPGPQMSPPRVCSAGGGSPAQPALSRAVPSVGLWWPWLCLSPNHPCPKDGDPPPDLRGVTPSWGRVFPHVQSVPSGAATCGSSPMLHHLLPPRRVWLHPMCNCRLLRGLPKPPLPQTSWTQLLHTSLQPPLTSWSSLSSCSPARSLCYLPCKCTADLIFILGPLLAGTPAQTVTSQPR